MTKYYLNGPYRCPGCFQIDFKIASDGDFCRTCSNEQKQDLVKAISSEKSENLWTSLWRILKIS